MRNIGSKLFVVLIAAIVVVGLVYAFMPQPVEVDLAEVTRGPLQVTVDEDGKTRIREKYVVSAPLAGRLLRIDMDAGDSVEAGETLLATIEPRDPDLLDARTIAQAEARVKAAVAALKKIEPMTEQVRAAQAYAEAELARARNAGSAVSKSELENAEYEYRRASEEQRSMRIQEEIAEFELEQARAALLRTRPRDDLEGNGQPNNNEGWTFTIYSPIDGQVLRVLQESAAVVTAGTPLLELGDPRDLEAEIDVLSRDAVKIRPGAKVWLEHWGGDEDLQGRVRIVEPSGFTKISTLGVEEQRVNVIVDFVDPPAARESLGDGFRVEARIVIDEADDVVKVPTSALYRVGKQSAVFQVVGDAVEQVIVKIGRQNGLEAEVIEGLAPGDRVVIHPSDQVEAGVRVRQR